MVFKTKKKKKSKRMHGTNTYGHGSRKKNRKSGEHGGGSLMSGSGKRADHKKTLITALYGNEYFGKQGITSRSTKKRKTLEINLKTIAANLDSLMKKFGKNNELVLKKYKILGDGDLKEPITIKARAFTNSAKERIEKIGGKALLIKVPKEIEIQKNKKEAEKSTEKKQAPEKKIKKDSQ